MPRVATRIPPFFRSCQDCRWGYPTARPRRAARIYPEISRRSFPYPQCRAKPQLKQDIAEQDHGHSAYNPRREANCRLLWAAHGCLPRKRLAARELSVTGISFEGGVASVINSRPPRGGHEPGQIQVWRRLLIMVSCKCPKRKDPNQHVKRTRPGREGKGNHLFPVHMIPVDSLTIKYLSLPSLPREDLVSD